MNDDLVRGDTMRNKLALATALTLGLGYATPAAARNPHRASVEADAEAPRAVREQPVHTTTWYCVDLNDLLHVDVPVVVPRAVLEVPADHPPVPTCNATVFPVVVPAGSAFTVETSWLTNKTYPTGIRDALVANGYEFVDANPMEDLMKKLTEVRIEVETFPGGELVAEYRFDPRAVFRRFEYRRAAGALLEFERVDGDLASAGIATVDELGRLPMISFPGIAGPLSPGEYRAKVYWTLSDRHNDGLTLEAGGYLPPSDGGFRFGAARFTVVP